jgi:hypothetical protein
MKQLNACGKFFAAYGVLILWVVGMVLLSGCTVIQHEDSERKVTIIDVHPMGDAIDVDAELEGKGSLRVNREQDGAADEIEAVGDAVKPGIVL